MLTLVASSLILLCLLLWLKEWFRFHALGSGTTTKPSVPPSMSHWQDQPPGRASPSLIASPLQTFSIANSLQSANTTSTASSDNSYHYTVTSINSYKCRTNVLHRHRADLPPITVSPDTIIASDIPTWDVEYLCAALLPDTETRLMPAGMVLLRALGLKGDYSQRASKWTEEEFRYCCQLFIVVAREVLLKDAAGAKELDRACNLLHETFKKILFKPFLALTTSSSAVTGPQVSRVKSPEIQRSICVLRALCSAMDTFKEALDIVEAPAASDEALRDQQRKAIWRLSVSTSPSLTMDQYLKELSQKLMQAQ